MSEENKDIETPLDMARDLNETIRLAIYDISEGHMFSAGLRVQQASQESAELYHELKDSEGLKLRRHLLDLFCLSEDTTFDGIMGHLKGIRDDKAELEEWKDEFEESLGNKHVQKEMYDAAATLARAYMVIRRNHARMPLSMEDAEELEKEAGIE